MIELDGITVSLPPRRCNAATVLDSINLRIGAGEWIALTGPNGSGKTTLLKILAGLVAPAAGRLRTERRDGAPPRIGFLFQEPDNQFVASSVRDELLLSLPPYAAESCIDEAVERFSLSGLLDRNPHRLSGGEKQRLAFATVRLSEPELLLLDEPTSYLDSTESERLTTFVAAMNARGAAVVWATPRDGEAGRATRVVRLAGGRIVRDGPPQPPKPASSAAPQASHAPPQFAAPHEAVVTLENAAFDYGEGEVISALSLDVLEGERAAICGRNGSGKSTVLGMISGLLKPTAGNIYRRYKRPVSGGQQNVFYLFQNPERLFFAETVREEVAFGLRSLGVPREHIGARVQEALRSAQLPPERFEARMPFSLSAGEMRRVAFAMAWALRPRLLLLDEPTSCLDDEGRRIFRNLMETARAAGTTTVVASHDALALSGDADRLVNLPQAA